MKGALLAGMFGLTGLGASGQMFPMLPPAPMFPPPALVRHPVFEQRAPSEIIKPSVESVEAPVMEGRPCPAPSDRMLIRPEPGVIGSPAGHEASWGRMQAFHVPETVEGVPGWEETFYGPWHKGKGIRFRVVFLNSRGVTWWTPRGFRMYRPGRGVVAVPAPEHTPLKESYGVYHAGDTARYRIEVQNLGKKALNGLTIESRQRAIDYVGRMGVKLPLSKKILRMETLEAGELTWRDGDFKMENPGSEPINFQQTDVTIKDAAGNVLADVERAAVIDPPAGE